MKASGDAKARNQWKHNDKFVYMGTQLQHNVLVIELTSHGMRDWPSQVFPDSSHHVKLC